MERASKPPVWPPGDTTQPQCTAQLKQSSDEMTRMEIHTSRSFLPGTLRCWIDHHLGLTSVPSVTNSKAGIDGQQSILLGGHSTSGIPATYVWGESIVAYKEFAILLVILRAAELAFCRSSQYGTAGYIPLVHPPRKHSRFPPLYFSKCNRVPVCHVSGL